MPEGFVYLVTYELFAGWVEAGMAMDCLTRFHAVA